MSAIIEATCTCQTIGADPAVVRFAECHHRYFRGDKRLESVTSVIRQVWPIKKNFEDADPWVLEHARDRGVRVDGYFSEYLRSGNVRIQAGEWREVVERTKAVVEWWDKDWKEPVTPQVILADNEIAGTADIVGDIGFIADLKNVSALDATYWIQVGAYADLFEKQFGHPAQRGALIHVTQPKDKPVSVKFVEVELKQAVADWRVCREMWAMVQRTKGKMK